MNPQNEVADLLERAADLYESEQIEWCRGTWAAVDDNPDGSFATMHCAEGALLRASGYTADQLLRGQGIYAPGERITDLMRQAPYYFEAVNAVKAHANLTYVGSSLYHYNDGLHHATAKQTLIQVFKETAKELRNGS